MQIFFTQIWAPFRINNNDSAAGRQKTQKCLGNKIIQEAIDVMVNALHEVSKSKTRYVIFSILCLVLFLASFVSSGFSHLTTIERIALDLSLFFPRMILVAGLVVYFLMGSLFSKREKNSIKEIKNQLALKLEQEEANLV